MTVDRERAFALVRTLMYFAIAPGLVAVVVPQLLAVGSRLSPLAPLGLLLSSAGVALVLWCGWHFAMRGRGTPAPYDAPRELVATGPYWWVRNPMYVATLLVIVGQAVAYGSLVIFVYAALVWLVFHAFVVLYEEPTLGKRFGGTYAEYRRRVPRWIPRRPR